MHPLTIRCYLFWRTCSHHIYFPKLVIRLLITGSFHNGNCTNTKRSEDCASKPLHSKKTSTQLKKPGEKEVTRGDHRCFILCQLACESCLLYWAPAHVCSCSLLLEKNTDSFLKQTKRNLFVSYERYLWMQKPLVLETQCHYTHFPFGGKNTFQRCNDPQPPSDVVISHNNTFSEASANAPSASELGVL